MVVRWSAIAEERLKSVFDWYFDVGGHSVAVNIFTKIVNAVESLSTMPFKAPVEKELTGRAFIYRSLVVGKMFKVVYFVDEKAECIVVATIHDCRRNPARLQDDIQNITV